MKSLGNPPSNSSVKILSQETILDLYRYFTAWTGNPEDACAPTLATVRRVKKPIGNHEGPDDRLMALAAGRYQRAFHASTRRNKPSNCFDVSPAISLPARLSLSRISIILQSMPQEQADAVVLTCFCDLSEPDLANLLGKPQHVVERILQKGLDRFNQDVGTLPLAQLITPGDNGAAIREEMTTLAESIFFPPQIIELIQKEHTPGRPAGSGLTFWDRWGWASRYKVRQAMSRILPTAIVFLALFALLLWYLQIKPPQVGLAQAPSSNNSKVVSIHTLSYISIGQLVQPSLATCTDWKTRLAIQFGADATEDAGVPFKFPGFASDQNALGTGCRVQLRILQPSPVDFPGLLNWAGVIFTQEGFSKANPFDCYDCLPSNPSSPGKWSGEVMSLEKGGTQAILLVAIQQDNRLSCPMSPSCRSNTPRETMIQLLLAQDAARPALDAFLATWQSGKQQALDWLTPELRKDCPTIAALDERAGFQRGPVDAMQLTWRIMANQGESVRLSMRGVLSSRILLPTREIPTFNLVMKDTPNGWKVSELSRQVIFSSSPDSVLWADKDGKVFRYRLRDGLLQNLAGPGMFHPPGEVPPAAQEKSFINKIISPDEKLAILYPNPYSDHPEQSIRIWTNDDIKTALWEADLEINPVLTWTSESQNIIVGSKPSQLGPIFQMNAQTGENKKIVDNAYLIGLETSTNP